MDTQRTSVYSDYQHNDNTSINSKQLEYWLNQIKSPQSKPQFGIEWTLMSSSSHHEPNQITFGRVNTFESYKEQKQGKQNNELNSNKQTLRTKSFVNAMIALQKRAQTLEQQNNIMQMSMNVLRDQKSKSMSESYAVQQELRNRVETLQQRLQKLQDLKKENKKLREGKDEKVLRIKIIEKSLKQAQKQIQRLTTQKKSVEEQKNTLQQKILKLKEDCKKVQQANKNWKEKLKSAEEGREKSNSALLQKYNKSVELYENLEKTILKLQIELANTKKKYEEQIKFMEEKAGKQAQEMRIENQKLNFENLKLNQQIDEYKEQIKYFKQQHRKKDIEILNMLRESRNFKKTELSKESQMIILPQTHTVDQKIQQQQWDNQSEIDIDLEDESKHPIQTKSVEKEVKYHKKQPKQKSFVSSQSKKVKSSNQKLKQPKTNQQNIYIKLPNPKSKKQRFNNPSNYFQSYQNNTKLGSFDLSLQPPYHSAQNCAHSNYHPQELHSFHDDEHTVDRLILIEAQKQAIRLYQQQQRLLNSSNQNCTQAERAEYIGRMKQLNQQIKLNSQKMFELKSKI